MKTTMRLLPASATDELWMRMASRYGHAWVSQYGAAPDSIAAAEWRETLSGLGAAQLREGFDADRSRGAEWPPSSTQFRSLCLGIPSLAAVRADIDHRERYRTEAAMCRFARGTWSRMDVYAYRNGDGRLRERVLREAYELTREFVMDGGTLPVEPAALIDPTSKAPRPPASPDVVKAHLDKMAKLLNVAPVKPHTEVDDDSAA